MAIWSFTQERLNRLHEQIARKKAEHDDLEALSEKDLWCRDLDEFEAEWENQLRLDSEIKTSIRRMGRRVSKKIGAGRGRKKDDDDFEPVQRQRAPKAAPKPKPVEKVAPPKAASRFADVFGASKPKKSGGVGTDSANDSDAFDEDDFAALKSKPVKKEPGVKKEAPAKKAAPAKKPVAPEPEESADEELDRDLEPEPEPELPPAGRTKRAAAIQKKTWILDDSDSDSNDDQMLGDIGAMVKGIGGGGGGGGGAGHESSEDKPRVSLYNMTRPESSHGPSASLKVKSKASKTFDMDSHDDTNYEMLARSSPAKPAQGDPLDDFLSDDDDDLPAVKKNAKLKISPKVAEKSAAASAASGPAVKKARGRPAATKAAAAKPTQLSPAAKLYAKKKAAPKPKKGGFDMDLDDDEEDDLAEPSSPPPKPAARGRPGRAAAAKAKPVYVVDEDSEDADDYDMDDSE